MLEKGDFKNFQARLDATTENKMNGNLKTKLLEAQLRTQEIMLAIMKKCRSNIFIDGVCY